MASLKTKPRERRAPFLVYPPIFPSKKEKRKNEKKQGRQRTQRHLLWGFQHQSSLSGISKELQITLEKILMLFFFKMFIFKDFSPISSSLPLLPSLPSSFPPLFLLISSLHRERLNPSLHNKTPLLTSILSVRDINFLGQF